MKRWTARPIGYEDDPRFLALRFPSLRPYAVQLMEQIMAYCGEHETDGSIPRKAVMRFWEDLFRDAASGSAEADEGLRQVGAALIEDLVRVGHLVHGAGEMYCSPDFLLLNPELSKEISEKKREGGRIGGIRSGQARRGLKEKVEGGPSRSGLNNLPTDLPTDLPKGTTTRTLDQSSEFDEFWTAYPKKVSKPRALKAWKRIKPDEVDAVMSGLERWKTQWAGKDAEFIPHPATWLNDRRWEDLGALEGSKPVRKMTVEEYLQSPAGKKWAQGRCLMRRVTPGGTDQVCGTPLSDGRCPEHPKGESR